MGVVVLKFGGTSVSTRGRWETIGQVAAARRAEGHTVVLVCSAMAGVTNRLEELLPAALVGAHEGVLAALRAGHEALAAEMGVPASLVDDDLDDLRRVATGVSLTGESTPRLRARAGGGRAHVDAPRRGLLGRRLVGRPRRAHLDSGDGSSPLALGEL